MTRGRRVVRAWCARCARCMASVVTIAASTSADDGAVYLLERLPMLEDYRAQRRAAVERRAEIERLEAGHGRRRVLNSCISRQFYSIEFPPPEGGVVFVTHPLRLESL